MMNPNPRTVEQTNNGRHKLTSLQTNTSSETLVDLAAMRCERMPVLDALALRNSGPVPGLQGYSYRLDIRDGFATYEIRERGSQVLSGVVVWHPAAEAEAWQIAQDATEEVGMIPVVVAETMGAEEVSMPGKPDVLPWAASSLRRGAINGGTGRSPLFLLAFRTTKDELATTGPVVAATVRPLAELANFELLLSCAILAQADNGQPD